MNEEIACELADLIRQFGRFVAKACETYADNFEEMLPEHPPETEAARRRKVKVKG